MSDGRLPGRIALITGGNTGIGSGICEAYAREGAAVAVAWHERGNEAAALVDQIHAAGGVAEAFEVDVRSERSVVDLFDRVGAAFGPVDLLVNNAGIQQARPLAGMSLDDFDNMLAVHLRGAFLCSREFVRRRVGDGAAHIINLCSQLGYIGRENYTAYSTAKGGMTAFTRALARELAPSGILVNGVAPGLVDTGFDPLSDADKQAHAESLPLKRLGQVADMTGAFVFLASDEGRYYCGQLLHPNGGEIMP
ncbi:MAG: SDR family NAD(P)-dependent oxidoreductase [Pseudomonadota bacterium]